MEQMNTRTRMAAFAAAAACLAGVAGSSAGADAQQTSSGGASLTAVALANPDPEHPKVDKTTVQLDRASGTSWDGDAIAQASATCAGCTATAATGQVVVFRSSAKVQSDNVATAWSQCDGCASTALSVQVIVGSSTPTLIVANRAMALNAACAGCTARAAAYQFVVLGAQRSELTPRARDLISEIRQLMSTALQQGAPAAGAAARQAAPNAAAPGGVRDRLDGLAARLQQQLGEEQGAPSVQVHGDVHTAG
jgi:hypothetical protein